MQALSVSTRAYRPLLRLTASVAAVALVLTASVGIGGVRAAGAAMPRAHNGPYKFVLSNNFLGNDWRPQVERLAQLTTQFAPFKGKVSVQIVNAASTTQAQIASLNDIIQSRPDALLVIPSSTAALNPVLQRACSAGIIVVTVASPVTAPCVWNVSQDQYKGNLAVGQWMAKVLHGTGGVFVDRGLPGVADARNIYNGFLTGLKQYGPHIQDIGEYDGDYAQGPEQQGISSLLVAHPTVSGVMTQGYCKPAFNAFANAGKRAVPTTCYAYNGELVSCAQGHHACAVISGSPVVVQIAMKLALDALEGKPTPSKSHVVPVPMTLFLTGPTVKLTVPKSSNVTVEKVVLGKNAFPQLAPGLALPYTLPQYKITPQQAVGR